MIFKRRDKLKPLKQIAQIIWPKGGWSRAVRYLSLRVNRLPDTPVRISRGILIGVVIAFSPFFGLHFILAAVFARILRGNILAAILATFVGNPLTYLPIALISLQSGHLVLGGRHTSNQEQFFGTSFLNATRDLLANARAFMTGMPQDWSQLHAFWHDVFFPYLIGGLILGVFAGIVAYYMCLPVITAYQKRRRGHFKARLKALKKKAAHFKNTPDIEKQKPDKEE
jgi:uncharacterized protein (DUF2062 family)